MESPVQLHERRVALTPPATDPTGFSDITTGFSDIICHVGMAVECTQIDLADLLAGGADEAEPRMNDGDPSADAQVKPLAAFRVRRLQMATIRLASRTPDR